MPSPRTLALAITLSLCAMTSPPLHAQPSAPSPCQAAERHQFDFWVGRWDVFDPAGKKAGENIIEAIDGGCVLFERWRGNGGFSGSSLNSWSAESKQWHQHWVDNQGGLLRLSGGLDGARMVLASNGPNPKNLLTAARRRRGAPALGAVGRRGRDMGHGLRRPLRSPALTPFMPRYRCFVATGLALRGPAP